MPVEIWFKGQPRSLKIGHSIDYIRLSISLPLFSSYLTFKISWPWNPGYGSLKVIENDAIWYIAYEFLLVFHCNYGRILYRFRNKARYWSNNADFSYPLVFNLRGPLDPLRIFAPNSNTNCPSTQAIKWWKPKGSENGYRRQTTDGQLMS